MLETINCQLDHPFGKEDKLADFLINQILDAAFCIEESGQFTYINQSMCVITEYSHKELLSMNLSHLDIDFSLNKWLQRWENLKNVESLSWKSRYRTKGGRTFVATIDFAYIQLQESEFCYGVIKENTQELVPILCHEFRTPLNVISFSNSLLKRNINQLEEEKMLSLVRHIETAVKQIDHILDDILFLSRTKYCQAIISPIQVNLIEFCENLVKKMTFIKNGRSIQFDHLGNCKEVWIDTHIIEAILTNLLDNAIKYSSDTTIVHLLIENEDKQIILKVKDQGIGIAQVDQDRLFEKFYRGHNVGQISGTGLGLSIVKTLVDLCEGQIIITSELGMGSTFTIVLPSLPREFNS
jgi:PAS domain S-box-containing protein